MKETNKFNRQNKETLSSALYLISSYYNMIEGEKNYAKQTHNKEKYVHYVGTQCKIQEIQDKMTKMINFLDMTQDGYLLFIGKDNENFLKNALQHATENTSWAHNIGEIDIIQRLHKTISE